MGLLGLGGLYLARRASIRREAAEWHTSASAITTRATSLRDGVAAEIAQPRTDVAAVTRWEDLTSRADRLADDLAALGASGRDDAARMDVQRTSAALTDLRMSMGSAPPSVVTPELHDRLAAFDAAVAQMQARTTAPG